MVLKEFKRLIEQVENGKTFEYGVSEPFSWRGVYAEVAFEIIDQPMTREEILANIEKAYTEEFYGHKGGTYRYSENHRVHFESCSSSWTNGEYCANWIAKIEGDKTYQDQETRLVKLAFSYYQEYLY